MKSQPLAWALVTGTAAVTAVGAFVPEPALAVGSVVLGGASTRLNLACAGPTIQTKN